MAKRSYVRAPHAFAIPMAGMAVMGGGAFESNQVNIIGGTTAFLRSTRCGVPGSEKPRLDPIHGAHEDKAAG